MTAVARPLVCALLLACGKQPAPQVEGRGPAAWEPEIASYEAGDRTNPPAPGGIVFVGSSSIRLWESLQKDFPGLPVLNRGFGGSVLSDVVEFANRIVLPYKPRTVVLYAGDNDLAAGKTPAQVFADFQEFVAIVHQSLPNARVLFIAIKPSVLRENIIDRIRATNQLIRDYVATDSKLVYVDIFTPMLDASGGPRRELFLEDGLHMNAKGYAIWRDLIAPVIR